MKIIIIILPHFQNYYYLRVYTTHDEMRHKNLKFIVLVGILPFSTFINIFN